MAESIALAASVIAVIQLADRISSICRYYIEYVRDCPSGLRLILLETSMLKTVFENLQLPQNSGTTSRLMASLAGQEGPIEACRKTIAALNGLFPHDIQMQSQQGSQSSQGSQKRRKLTATLAALAWPLKENRARNLMEEISQYKATIVLVLTTESYQDVKDVKSIACDIKVDTSDIKMDTSEINATTMEISELHDFLTESQRHDVCRWLQRTDPSPLHNRACNLYEPGTGDWMVRSPEWTDWIYLKRRCLWVHGIPGAGKTILMSYLTEKVKSLSYRSPRIAHAYYYCYYGHNQEEAVPFISSILNQLCRQANNISTDIYDMYKAGGEPNLVQLKQALEGMLDHFDTVYVVIDALDESNPRATLLGILQEMINESCYAKLQLLASSREYLDIERAMATISVSISMSNPYVENDIRRLVRSLIASNSKFKRWPHDMLEEVEDAVTYGAQGMFRWAVCQIDVLQRVKCDSRIVRAVLSDLPKTLDETYDRLLLAIPLEEQLYFYHALHWILFHGTIYDHEIPSSILLNAAEHSTSMGNLKQLYRFYDIETLRDVCGCLIQVSPMTQGVTFAHYTVKEYLSRTRVYQGVHPGLSKPPCLDIVYTQALRIHLKSMSYNPVDPKSDWDAKIDGNFHLYCAMTSFRTLSKWEEEVVSRTCSLAVHLLDPSGAHVLELNKIIRAVTATRAGKYRLLDSDAIKWLWGDEWRAIGDADVKHLFNIVSSTALVERFIRSRDPMRTPLAARVTFTTRRRYHGGDPILKKTYSGTIMDVLPQLSFDARSSSIRSGPDKVYDLLLRKFAPEGCDIAMYIGAHLHEASCQEFCALKHLLDHGGDLNGTGYRISPLQIAVHSQDCVGVEMLLEAGADSNGTGDPAGRVWENSEVFSSFNKLTGFRPLRIVRENLRILENNRVTKDENELKKWKSIETTLLQYGATDLEDDKPYSPIADFAIPHTLHKDIPKSALLQIDDGNLSDKKNKVK